MGFSIKNNIKVAVTKETAEGVYQAPTDTDFITSLEDGLEINGTKESLDRNILGLGLTKAQPRTANRTVTGSIPVEYKSSGVEGDAPEYGILMESALGGVRQNTVDVTTTTGHTDTVLNIDDADIANFNIGDIILIKEAGAFHLSPITAVDTTIGAANVTLLVGNPGAVAFTDGVDIAQFTTYFTADSGHPTFSITKYIEDNIKTIGTGARVNALSLESFTANQTASWNFGFEGLDFETSVEALTNNPIYDTALPPIIASACIYKNGVELPVSELSIGLENTIGTITSTCAKSGKLASRISERTVTGTMTPYISCDDVNIQQEFENDELYSIFGFAYNPTMVDGEYHEVVAFYIPNANTTELAEGDLDGVLQHNITFSASGGATGTETQLFITFI